MKPPLSRNVIACSLIAVSLIVYLPVIGNGFVEFDDPDYVSRNVHVRSGMNIDDLTWALTTTQMGNWHPLVWLSFQLDSHCYGNEPWGFHLTNVLVHTLSVVVLFLTLQRMGLRIAIAASVALLFCIHPLNVESVVWVSERKGVLSTLFWILGMFAYAEYARNPNRLRMALVLLCMAAGLMSKPSLLTFPFALILLDVWPLRRLSLGILSQTELDDTGSAALTITPQRQHNGDLISLLRSATEKIPLFLLSLAFFFIAYRAQAGAGAVALIKDVSLGERLVNIPYVYVLYLWHLFVPLNLTVGVLGPVEGAPAGLSLLAFVLLMATSIYACRTLARWPFFFVGWFWFLGTMFPTSGIVPIGIQWMADRYMYIPGIGLFLILCTACVLVINRFSLSRPKFVAVGVCVIILLGALSIRQSRYWENSFTLFQHAIQVDPENHFAHSNLASLLIAQGDYRSALDHAEQALRSGPNSAFARNNHAICMAKLGQAQEALQEFQAIIELDPTFAQAHLNLGNLLRASDPLRAEAAYRTAIKLDDGYAEAHNNLGGMLASRDPNDAKKHFDISLRLQPENADLQSNLGNWYARRGEYDQAIRHYRNALALSPDHAVARQNLDAVSQMIETAIP